jgi:8-oxo-dGTP pyrophosphatase MutT (NUDIX family)
MRQLLQQLKAYLQPNNTLAHLSGPFPKQAAVLVLFTDDLYRPEIIFTLRARHLSNHPGEVAFPGGMWEPQDDTLLMTALRETHEEIGLCPSAVQVLGSCKPRSTRAGICVTPFVGVIPAGAELVPNLAELDTVFRVPLAEFHSGMIQTRTDIFSHGGQSFRVPAYEHQGYEIWGFTAALTTEIINAIVAESGEIALIQ